MELGGADRVRSIEPMVGAGGEQREEGWPGERDISIVVKESQMDFNRRSGTSEGEM